MNKPETAFKITVGRRADNGDIIAVPAGEPGVAWTLGDAACYVSDATVTALAGTVFAIGIEVVDEDHDARVLRARARGEEGDSMALTL